VTPHERLQTALQSTDPAPSLRAAIHELFRKGVTKAQVYDLLEELLLKAREKPDGLASQEDLLLDTMDALTGWCHPDAQLLP
jgi:hypothetical protein